MSEFVNKVAESGIKTLDLEQLYPRAGEVVVFDLKAFLFMGLILKEKDFREQLKQLDVSPYQDKIVAITCTADAIIPMWAYMLVTSLLQPVATRVLYGTAEAVTEKILLSNIDKIDANLYAGERVVLKGCGEVPVSEAAYIAATEKLRPVVKSLMFGEPCSTVPVYKQPMVRQQVL